MYIFVDHVHLFDDNIRRNIFDQFMSVSNHTIIVHYIHLNAIDNKHIIHTSYRHKINTDNIFKVSTKTHMNTKQSSPPHSQISSTSHDRTRYACDLRGGSGFV